MQQHLLAYATYPQDCMTWPLSPPTIHRVATTGYTPAKHVSAFPIDDARPGGSGRLKDSRTAARPPVRLGDPDGREGVRLTVSDITAAAIPLCIYHITCSTV